MAYDGRFYDAVNYAGKRIHADSPGSTVEYCGHRWLATIRESFNDRNIGGLTFTEKTFDGFDLICLKCGEIEYVSADDVVAPDKKEDKIAEVLPYVGMTDTERWAAQDREAKMAARKGVKKAKREARP